MNVKNNSVDVIIPNYNKGKYLKKSIESVINQTFKNWKLYIVDDNSNDNSKEILNYYKKNKKIRVLYLKKNIGPGLARNRGLIASKSKYIAFLDSDDYWKTNKLKSQILFMKKHNLNFTYTDYISFHENIEKFIKTNLVKTINYDNFINNSSINTSTMILKRSTIQKIKFKKNTKIEDYVFKCELLKKGLIAHKHCIHSAYYRILKNSRSGKKIDNIYHLWKANKLFNKLSFFKNVKLIILISINSFKKYGLK